MTKDQFLVFGHRGASKLAPDNSLLAFRKAIDLKADYIEFDLRISIDNRIVIHHDDKIEGNPKLIKNMSIDELKLINIGNGEKIPTLDELIELTRGKIKLQAEILVPGIVSKLLEVLRKENLIGSSIISSFEIAELLKVKDKEEGLKLGYLIPRALTRVRIVKRYLQRAINNNFFAIHPYYPVVDIEFVEFAHSYGLKVHVFTVNEEDMMIKLIDLGVDGIFTDDIALLNSVLGRS
jgi:glycerophosphoryl diester phosphodiesterase